jgi:RluA family pseudouridine synthase
MTPEQFKESILFEDKFLLIVNKAAGIAVEKISPQIITLEDLVYSHLLLTAKKPFVGIVHRLDRPTSGIILFAKKPSVLKIMNAQFEKRTVRKYYVALVDGEIPNPSGSLKDYLHKDFFQKKAIISNQKSQENQEVKLNFRKIGLVGHRPLLNIELLTGKYHQIRAQLAYIGCPIAGDTLYGGTAWDKEGIGLHASALQFDHPETKERITIKSDWDIDSIPI